MRFADATIHLSIGLEERLTQVATVSEPAAMYGAEVAVPPVSLHAISLH